MADERSFKIRFSNDQTGLYLDALLHLRTKAQWFFTEDPELIAPFVLTCAAALECLLNDALIGALDTSKDEAVMVDGFLSMTLKGKLFNTVPIVTRGDFMLNSGHKVTQSLVELVRVRNRLVHNRSDYEERVALLVDTPEDGPHLKVDWPEKKQDFTFGIEGDVGRFHDGIIDLYNKFVCVWDGKKFEGNDLIVPMTTADNRIRIVHEDE